MATKSLTHELGLDGYSWADGPVSCQAEAPRVVEALGKVANLLGEATAELASLEANYRQWRSVSMANYLAGNPKTGEWKAKVETESEPVYLKHYEDICDTTEQITILKALQVALLAKRDLIVAILAM